MQQLYIRKFHRENVLLNTKDFLRAVNVQNVKRHWDKPHKKSMKVVLVRNLPLDLESQNSTLPHVSPVIFMSPVCKRPESVAKDFPVHAKPCIIFNVRHVQISLITKVFFLLGLSGNLSTSIF